MSEPSVTRRAFSQLASTSYENYNDIFLRSTLVSDLSSTMDKKDDVNKSWSKWKSTLLAAVDRAIPKKRIKNVHSPRWINGEITHAIKKKETVRRKLKSSSSSLMEKFKELRNKVKQLVNESRAHPKP